jgi:hypothetical protein
MSFAADPYIAMTLADEDVDTAAWFCLNKAAMLSFAPREESFDELPGVDGVFPYMEFADQQTIDLQFVMTGTVDPDGVPYSDAAAGLAANKRLFADTYLKAARNDYGLIACGVTDVDGTALIGQVKTRRVEFSEGLFECGVVLSVNIPAGELVEFGS